MYIRRYIDEAFAPYWGIVMPIALQRPFVRAKKLLHTFLVPFSFCGKRRKREYDIILNHSEAILVMYYYYINMCAII